MSYVWAILSAGNVGMMFWSLYLDKQEMANHYLVVGILFLILLKIESDQK